MNVTIKDDVARDFFPCSSNPIQVTTEQGEIIDYTVDHDKMKALIEGSLFCSQSVEFQCKVRLRATNKDINVMLKFLFLFNLVFSIQGFIFLSVLCPDMSRRPSSTSSVLLSYLEIYNSYQCKFQMPFLF